MNREQIIRAWKDEEYRESLGEGERALLPENPAGIIELSDAQLDVAGGDGRTEQLVTFGCCYWTSRIDGSCSNTFYIVTYGCCKEIAPSLPG